MDDDYGGGNLLAFHPGRPVAVVVGSAAVLAGTLALSGVLGFGMVVAQSVRTAQAVSSWRPRER